MNDELMQYAPLFAGLSVEQRKTLGDCFNEGSAAPNEPIFRAGETATALYMIGQGFVRMTSSGGQVLATLGPGSIVGDDALFRGLPHDVTATALSGVQFWTLSDRALRDLVLTEPATGILLGQNCGAPITQMQDYLVQRLARTAELQGLPPNTLQAVAAQLQGMPIAMGQPLFRAGEAPSGLFLLESGSLEVRTETGEAAQAVRPGAILGALALLTNKPYAQSIVATDDSLVWGLSAENFTAVNSRHPGLRRSLARTIRARLSRADQAAAVTRLQQMPLFAEVPQPVMQSLAQRMVLQHVPAGDRVYRVGESGDALFLIEQGEIELTAENAMGVIEERARISAGGFFGEMSMLTGQVRTEDATATRNTNLWGLAKNDLDAVASQNPTLSKSLSHALATRLAASATPEVDDSRFRNFELLAGLSTTELAQVVEVLRPTRYRTGDTVFRVNQPGDGMYLIERGQVRIQPLSGGSYVLGPGDEFGERSLLANQPHNVSATAESDIDVWLLSKQDFSLLMSRSPGLAINLSRILSQRVGQTQGTGATATWPQIPAAGRPGAGPPPPPAGQPYAGQPYAGQPGVGQPGAPAGETMGQAPRPRPVPTNYDEYGDYPAPPPRERRGFGAWFGGQTTWGKIRFILLIILLLWLLIAIPWAIMQLMGLAYGTETMIAASPADSPSALAAVYARGSYDVSSDPSLAQAVEAADSRIAATPTYTPYPTATPLVAPTPQAVAMAATGREYTTDLMNLAPPVESMAAAAPAPAPVEAAPPPAPEAAPAPSRNLDSRLPALGVTVEDAAVEPGQPYWRVVEVRFADEVESGGKHHIYVDALDETGNRVVGQPVTVWWGDGNYSTGIEDKPAPDFGFNYMMYAAGYAYNAKIEGMPSDVVKGMGMGDVANRFKGIHTSYYVTFQKATK